MFYIFLLYTLLLKNVNALIGYDCGSRKMSITTISLRDIGECDISENNINIMRSYVQLLQINDYNSINVIQCKVEIHRTVYYCGLNSHISIVLDGENEYIYDINKQACKDLHKTGALRFENHEIPGIRVNNTHTRSILFAGHLTKDGQCSGADYSDPFGIWESVVVQGTVKVTLNEYTTRVDLNNNNIYLRSGTVCLLSEESCIDLGGGHTFWETIPNDNCKFYQYGVLYEGFANKMLDYDLNLGQTVYSIAIEDLTFAFTAKGKRSICGCTIIKTEHPKLFIFETTKGQELPNLKKISLRNFDIFSYVNSKFVYVERYIKSQMKQLYKNIVIQRCNLESQAFQSSLSMATQAPDQFAFDLMKGPGYMAVPAGEVVHIVKCIPVEVKVQHGEDCYAELQVSRNNNTFFLTPRTHILKSKGTKILCNALLPSLYFLGDEWYKILPRPVDTKAPIAFKFMSQSSWKYNSPNELTSRGIYTEKDLEGVKESIMFLIERPTFLNDLAREMKGHPVSDNEEIILRLLSEKAVEKIIDRSWNLLWSRFLTLGTLTASVIAMVITIFTIKQIIDVIIHAYTLHSAYGCSFYLLGSLWTAVTHLLLYLKRPKVRKNDVESALPLNSYVRLSGNKKVDSLSEKNKQENVSEKRKSFTF